MNEVMGYIIIAVPFILLFIYIAMESGIKKALLIFGFVAIVNIWVACGCYFLNN